MSTHLSSSGFQGLQVGALESRMAPEMERLILRHGGQPLVAPSMKERPLSEHSQALDFGKSFLSGQFDILILLTGVGFRTLLDILQTQDSLNAITQALQDTVLVVRGPKPAGVLKELGVSPEISVPEPNTWRDLLKTLDVHYPNGLQGIRIAVQEYGVTNADLLEGLRERGASVVPVPVYRWTLPDNLEPLENLIHHILEGNVSALLITNAVQVDHLFQISEKNLFYLSLNHRLGKPDGGLDRTCGERATTAIRPSSRPGAFSPQNGNLGQGSQRTGPCDSGRQAGWTFFLLTLLSFFDLPHWVILTPAIGERG